MKSPDFTPEWAKHAIWYQIFPERFCNGDPANDPTLASLQGSYPHDLSEPWQVHPWTVDIYQQQPYELVHHKDIWHHLQRRRYGGDLQGIFDRLDYSAGPGNHRPVHQSAVPGAFIPQVRWRYIPPHRSAFRA